jgi:hypothetical protein
MQGLLMQLVLFLMYFKHFQLLNLLVVIDGFEHILLEEGAASEGWRLHVLLSRLLGYFDISIYFNKNFNKQ